ncbi:MAG: 50S ribosomal protein L11 methyltransferase [Bdellovibrionaceae bacterium]|nr:50S ribosomal protein L11 methyltransferase [Pseudobdellovibrionaceae bacterium]
MENEVPPNYFRVRLRGLNTIEEDVLSSLVFDFGASGISEVLAYAQPDLTYEPKILYNRAHDVDIFFPQSPSSEFFEAVKSISPNVQWEIHEEESKDWLEEWKKGFKPFSLVGPYWIVPSWEKVPETCKKAIFIDPGMAFGTGTHATTQMAAYFVHKLAEQTKEMTQAMSFLDVGTGTAILAMLAKMSGFNEVVGIEIDPEARRVARENIKLNGLNSISISDLAIEDINKKFDVVIANIIDGVLIQIRQDLLKCVNPGGALFLTGILTERDNYFFEKFIENSGFQVIRRLEKDEWVGYWLKDNSHAQILA